MKPEKKIHMGKQLLIHPQGTGTGGVVHGLSGEEKEGDGVLLRFIITVFPTCMCSFYVFVLV